MPYFIYWFIKPAPHFVFDIALAGMRIAIGILALLHGYPKLMGGIAGWQSLGAMAMNPLGIYFLPTLWGGLAACTEFFGGIALILGLGVRPASLFLAIMMVVAAHWHIQKGDYFQVYSFSLTLIVVYIFFFIIGGDLFSLDYYLTK
jgi:putative oxidoreductase